MNKEYILFMKAMGHYLAFAEICGRADYLAVQFGLRFSTKASGPSLLSEL